MVVRFCFVFEMLEFRLKIVGRVGDEYVVDVLFLKVVKLFKFRFDFMCEFLW